MPSISREELDALAHELRVCAALAHELSTIAGRIIARLQTGLERPVQGMVQGPLHSSGTAAAAHRAAHVKGTPSRISGDPELEAFLLARVGFRTFPQLAQDVKDAFPPERRVAQSSIWRWWQRRRKVPA